MNAEVAQWTDPLHSTSRPDVHWTRANAEEIFPAAITHFTWTFVGPAGERGWRESFVDVGILTPAESERPDDPSDCAWAIFYGRPAFNYAHLKSFAFAAFSSTDPDAVARRSSETLSERVSRLAKTAWSVLMLPARLHRVRVETEDWWRRTVASPESMSAAQAAQGLEKALLAYQRASRQHVLNSTVPVAWAYARIADYAKAAGTPELASTLMSGFSSLEEVQLAQAIWNVARGEGTLTEFMSRYGYRGPVESEASSPSWREDPAPVQDLIENLRQTGKDKDPSVAQQRRIAERHDASKRLLHGLPFRERLGARIALMIGRRYVPLRQVGKVSLVQSIDAARACARVIGRGLKAQGKLANADDVFMLTVREVISAASTPLDSYEPLVEWRRERRNRYLAMTIPREFSGVPEVLEAPAASAAVKLPATQLPGLGVSSGIVEGIARVLTNACDDLEPGEILVSQFTDPGWTPLLVVASGVVLDVGGVMSHGAIIARELGIPCVVGTASATREIRTGDRLRIDGGKGLVEILERAP